MINIHDIEEACYKPSIPKTYQLYQNGYVKKLEVQNNYPFINVSAQVKGSCRDPYWVMVSVDELENRILDYHCDCPAYEEYDGLCKHCGAVLLAYVMQRNSGRGAAGTVRAAKDGALVTSDMVKSMLSYYGLQQKIPLWQSEIYGKVKLIPILNYRSGSVYLEFKIGVSKLYIVKNISEFVDSVEHSLEYTYGKGLSFYHTKETFTEESRPFVEFICQAVQSDDVSYNSYAYDRGFRYRMILLKGFTLDYFISLMVGKTLEFNLHEEIKSYLVQRKNPPSILKIKEEKAGVFLELSRYSAFEGAEYIYYLYSGTLYITKKTERELLNSFRACFNSAKDRRVFIAKQELPIFCRELLPILKEQYEVLPEAFDESLYLPQKAVYEIYLDMPQEDEIQAKVYAIYQEQKYNLLKEAEIEENRDIRGEYAVIQALKQFFNAYDENVFILSDNEERLYSFLSEGILELHNYGEVHISERIRKLKILSAPRITIGVNIEGNLLEFAMQSEDMSLEELAEILSRYSQKQRYYRLKNGTFFQAGEELDGAISIVKTLQLKQKDLQKGKIAVPKYRALYLDGVARELGLDFKRDRNFKNLVRNMKTAEENDFEIPSSLDTILRNYQKSGFLWLKTLLYNGFGGILADDMGLGKTLQVIALLQSVYEEQKEKLKTNQLFALIVAPASLVYNWKKEMEQFAPDLSVVMLTGTAAERKAKLEQSLPEQIFITSYDLLKRDLPEYQQRNFQIQVIDEAQYIKNAASQAAKAVKSIFAGFKVALTGTPIENRLSELWSIFDYLMLGFLYHYLKFRQEFEIPITGNGNLEAKERLRRMIQPFVLRRLKKDVLTDLPDKLEKVVYASLEGEQKELYLAHVGRLKLFLEKQSEAELNTAKLYVLSELTKLRQLCCNPSLLYEDCQANSAKLELCIEMIRTAAEGGHKVLVFSQFTSNFELLEKRLEEEQLSWYRLTGATKKEERIVLVEQFNQNQVPVFLISLKAGGTGLNLTAADIVIHYDPWWNFAVQNQATDRVHRIGQKNVVTVYKLIIKDTIEEKIIALQEQKRDLAEQVLGGKGMDTIHFSKEELLELLK